MSNTSLICPKCGSDEIFTKGEVCLCSDCGARFAAAPKPFRAMKLFLSYGHPEQVICARIADALRRRGHQVWFDADHIRRGSDWRERIASGVASSNGVVACLSRHSVRQPGVCLDELSIAVGVRGGNIHTILLEEEAQVQPPASVCHIQWLDMQDWRARMAQGEETFERWFGERMEQLFEMLESDESYRFAGQIETVRGKLTVCHDTAKQKHLLAQRFVGRAWLTEQVEAWLDDPAGPRLCVLYGDPGVGKSAFAAHYLHYNPRAAAGLFCEQGRPHYNDPRTVIQTLAYLLACRLPAYRVVLADRLEWARDLSALNPSELFDLLLAEPLSTTVDGGHETLCILIDGLDECGRAEHNALAEVLARYVPRLPGWLRVLVTSRRVAAVTAALGQEDCFALNGDGEENRADLRAYFEEVLGPRFAAQPGWPAALEELTRRSGGIFLYARLVCEGLLAGRLSLDEPDALPTGLGQVFHHWFGWFFPDEAEYRARFRPALGLLLAAPAPLPAATLCRVLDWDEDTLGDFTRRVGVLLRTAGGTLTFSHKYLCDWLAGGQAGRFGCSTAAGHRRLAEGLFRLFERDVQGMSLYEAACLPGLLAACGMEKPYLSIAMNGGLARRIRRAVENHRPALDPRSAADCLSIALELARLAAAMEPTDPRAAELTLCRSRLAERYHALGRLSEAAQTALDCLEGLPQARDGELLAAQIAACRVRAEVLLAQGQTAPAAELLEQALLVELHQLCPEDPAPALLRYDRDMARVRRAEGDPGRAAHLYRQARRELKALGGAERAPWALRMQAELLDAEAQAGLEELWCRPAGPDMARTAGRRDELAEQLRQALALRAELPDPTPADRRARAADRARLVRLDPRPHCREEALAELEALVAGQPLPDDLACFIEGLLNLSAAERDEGLCRRALAAAEVLTRRRGTPADRTLLAACCEALAACLGMPYQKAEAAGLVRRAEEIRLELPSPHDPTAELREQFLRQRFDLIRSRMLRKRGALRSDCLKALVLIDRRLALRCQLDDLHRAAEELDLILALCGYELESGAKQILQSRRVELCEMLVQRCGTPAEVRSLHKACGDLARLCLSTGQPQAAHGLYRRMEELADHPALSAPAAEALPRLLEQAKLAERLDLRREEQALLDRCQGLCAALKDRALTCTLNRLQADLFEKQGRPEQALGAWYGVLACVRDEAGRELYPCLLAILRLHRQLGETEQAARLWCGMLPALSRAPLTAEADRQNHLELLTGSQEWFEALFLAGHADLLEALCDGTPAAIRPLVSARGGRLLKEETDALYRLLFRCVGLHPAMSDPARGERARALLGEVAELARQFPAPPSAELIREITEPLSADDTADLQAALARFAALFGPSDTP